MAESVKDIKNPFKEVYEALDMRDQRKAMRSAMRKEGNRIKKVAAQALGGTGLNHATAVAQALRVRVYPDRYGLGFMVDSKPRGKKGYHKNRQGKEKPILMWAAEGTKTRKTKSKTKFFIRKKRGHSTGSMPAYPFLEKTENQQAQATEVNLFANFQTNLERAFKKKNLL